MIKTCVQILVGVSILTVKGNLVLAAIGKTVQVKPYTVQLTNSIDTLVYPARIESQISAVVLAQAEGTVTDIAPLGSILKKGQRILKVQQSDPVYQFAPVRVLAPVSGVLTSLEVTEGSQINKGQRLALITDPAKIRVTVEVAGRDIQKIKIGMKGEFRPSESVENLAVTVEAFSPVISSSTGTSTCILSLDKKKKTIPNLIGDIGRVTLSLQQKAKILVPETAIVYRGADPFVRIIENQIAKYRSVTLGSRGDGKIEILTGVKLKEIIVERAAAFVADNAAVEIEKTEIEKVEKK
jgi:hypothetical protein